MWLVVWFFCLVAVAMAGECESPAWSGPPVIDLSLPDQHLAVLQASQEWGFFQIANHNLSSELLGNLSRVMVNFFSKPLEEKLRVKRTATNSRGFAHDELTKQIKDYKEVFDYGFGFGDTDGANQWPENAPPEFQAALHEYFQASTRLAQHVMDLVARGLGVDPTVFRDAFAKHSSFARLNYYPPLPAATAPLGKDLELGISRHTDAGALTILWQDSPGLQVYSGTKQDNQDGEWVDVRVVPGALVVNVGDMLEVWSGGRIRAAEHRVVVHPSPRHRLSVPFFFNPDYAQVMQAITGPRKFRSFTWERFRRARFAGDYADLGTESQIEDYELAE
ncbi:hypothetical protein BASA81_010269 [Batrachochytrium salamandrivorans]|nr:hypothetical protein BASA81_010269 [Batrachochytrium salamandrivorans]